MNISLSSPALKWFEQEMEAGEGDAIRFFARYGGHSPIHPGFSIGVTKAEPFEPWAQTTKNGIVFYVEEKDGWYFEGYDLHVKYSRKYDMVDYEYVDEK